MRMSKSISCGFLIMLVAVGAIAQQRQEAPVIRPLRIVSKPNAAYPVEAQRAMVTGGVLLRISFLADGSLGEIVCVNTDEDEKSLFEEYGLIASAHNAARRIVFEPKTVDGKAVGVNSTLAYVFRMR